MPLTPFCHSCENGEWFLVFRDCSGRLWAYDPDFSKILCPVCLKFS